MANHCINGISFHGKDLTKIKEMIAEAIEVNKTHVGWLPESVDVSKLSYAHYLFDIEINGETEDSISFACWTKWSPPIEELEYICRDAKVNCTCWYEESGIYGRVLIFGDKREADDDCRGNESVIRCTDLPVHWQETILKQLNNL